jgi:hypothetical protein
MKKLDKLILEILTQMYAEATPPLDLEKAMAEEKTKQEFWFHNHILLQERQDTILEEALKGKRLTNLSKASIRFNVHNYAPKGI